MDFFSSNEYNLLPYVQVAPLSLFCVSAKDHSCYPCCAFGGLFVFLSRSVFCVVGFVLSQ